MAKITILKIKQSNAGNLKAIVDFQLGQSEFYSWRIIQQEGQKAWVSPPQESWEKDGKKQYKPLIKFPQELMRQVSDELIKAWEGAE